MSLESLESVSVNTILESKSVVIDYISGKLYIYTICSFKICEYYWTFPRSLRLSTKISQKISNGISLRQGFSQDSLKMISILDLDSVKSSFFKLTVFTQH